MSKQALKTTEEGEEQSSLSSYPISASRQRRRFLVNTLADIVVRLGGLAVLLSISAIFLVILIEAIPLFRSARAERTTVSQSGMTSELQLAGYFSEGEGEFVLSRSGELALFYSGSTMESAVRRQLSVSPILSSTQAHHEPDFLYLGLAGGEVARMRLPTFPLRTEAAVEIELQKIALDPSAAVAIEKIAALRSGTRELVVGVSAPNSAGNPELFVHSEKPGKGLMGAGKKTVTHGRLTLPSSVSSLALGSDGETAYLGYADGSLAAVDVRRAETPIFIDNAVISAQASPVRVIRVLLGNLTLAVGRESGEVETWTLINGKLQQKFKIYRHSKPVVALASSLRNRTFLSLDESGKAAAHFATSGETQLEIDTGVKTGALIEYAGRGDSFSVVGNTGIAEHWSLENPHPEVSLKTLFGKVWYEGYAEPSYVWQSSSGSDEFEPKFSLTPLLFGTMKGTFYSLLFAVPIALLGALYTAEFMSARMKAFIKPTLELMAALPSVVIGFIAGLWLAPTIEPYLPAVMIFPLCLLFLVGLSCVSWSYVPEMIRAKAPQSIEMLLLLPVVLLAILFSYSLGSSVESGLLGADYQHWLRENFNVIFDQRNSIVVGFAMGFAIVPIIFTIAEDSLSNVPRQLAAGSLALGASRWQTAMRVIVPAASPGIFSAIMLGFGRAVGETMIVLMATGNTPIMDASPANGFRALSANIAVELPEAAVGGTLFRVLFFAALLLFMMTFLVNTLTELVRQRLRRKYSQV